VRLRLSEFVGQIASLGEQLIVLPACLDSLRCLLTAPLAAESDWQARSALMLRIVDHCTDLLKANRSLIPELLLPKRASEL